LFQVMVSPQASASSSGSGVFAFEMPLLRRGPPSEERATGRWTGAQSVWITQRGFGRAVILELHGAPLDTAAGNLLQTEVRTRLASGARLLILDLADTSRMDDDWAHALQAVAATVHQCGRELRIAADADAMTALRLSTGAAPARFFATVDDAVNDVRCALEDHHSRLTAGWLRSWLEALRTRCRADR
jgi:anti-anti-sigma regulatory factor